MAYVEFLQRIILESEIIGIGPIFARTGDTSEVCFFDLYCRHTTIRIESNTIAAWLPPKDQVEAKKNFIDAHAQLKERIEYLLAD